MKVWAVLHDEYYGHVALKSAEIPDDAPTRAVWDSIMGEDNEPGGGFDALPPNVAGYVEDWNAYGSHDKGMVSRIWWGDRAEQHAKSKYNGIRASGVPEAMT
jgi:hypothetical protein